MNQQTPDTGLNASGLPGRQQWACPLPHTQAATTVLEIHQSSKHGLSQREAAARLELVGPNTLPESKPPSILRVFLYQFKSPLIYVLLISAILSVVIQEWSDAGFIAAVLLINGLIGTIQEHSAQRAALALRNLVSIRCRVLRNGDSYEIDAREIVPGDILLLESGDRIPADVRLLNTHDMEVDESLLTGESNPVRKDAELILEGDTALGDRRNMLFAGSMTVRGRCKGVVTATTMDTVLGELAASVLGKPETKAPLLIRMESFTHRVALIIGVAAIVMAAVAFSRGTPLNEIFLLAVALAVSAIPEGLPVALTVALAIGMRKMAKRNVIVRRLVAVEALGSCTFIATDKTGTLTVNQLTVSRLVLPGATPWEVTGSGLEPEGHIVTEKGLATTEQFAQAERLCQAAVLTNDGYLTHRDGGWVHHGDAVDVALLVLAHKLGITRPEALNTLPEIDTIPFESERLFCASLNGDEVHAQVSVKGALEKLLPMCSFMQDTQGLTALDAAGVEQQAQDLAALGYRVLAIATGTLTLAGDEVFSEEHLEGLILLGLVGMIDPLRTEAKAAIATCHKAGIEVAMVTGDHPVTALAIAKELGLAESSEQVITGTQLKHAGDNPSIDALTREARVYARVEPHQKLEIVEALQRNGHFVAVSGDGANDAPALRAAHVGVAMGGNGTDVARETSDLIITDDNFSSIINGVEEGRIAYANVRKVIFLLISTGIAELVLFTLALFTGVPLPLVAVQLLWLNLVTNGIQDVALAFEPGEGDELHRAPRPPKEPIFNQVMIERVVISALVMGIVAFLVFSWLLNRGYTLDEARNGTLLLMVLFENIHAFNSRSESRSIFRHNPLTNPVLLIGTLLAQLVHIGAMYSPWISDILRIQPVSPEHWLELLGLALTVLAAMELHKLSRRRRAI